MDRLEPNPERMARLAALPAWQCLDCSFSSNLGDALEHRRDHKAGRLPSPVTGAPGYSPVGKGASHRSTPDDSVTVDVASRRDGADDTVTELGAAERQRRRRERLRIAAEQGE